MTRLRYLLWLVFACGGALYMLFQVKFEVQALEKQLKALNAQIYNNQQAIHVLTAEWSHLNDPSRLAELNARHLQFVPVEAAQLSRLGELPLRMMVPPDVPEGAALAALQPAAPSASAPSVVPVTRAAPFILDDAEPAAKEVRPTVAGAILTTLTGSSAELGGEE